MTLAAIGLRCAVGFFGKKTGKVVSHILGWFFAIFGASIAGIFAASVFQPVMTVDALHFRSLEAVITCFLITCTIEAIAFVATQLTHVKTLDERVEVVPDKGPRFFSGGAP